MHYGKLTKFRLVCLLVLASTLSVYSQSSQFRPATKQDLIGTWKQIAAGSKTMDVSDPWYSALQYFEFFEDGYMKHMIIKGEKAEMDAIGKIAWRHSPKTTKYEFLNANGRIKVNFTEGDVYLILCTYYPEDMSLPDNVPNPEKFPKRGDITLTYLNEKTGEPRFFRLLRRASLE